MKAHLSILQKRPWNFLLCAFTIFSLASCQKENPSYAYIPSSGVMAYNLASDLPAVAFTVGTTPISGALNVGGHTTNYVPVTTGEKQLGALNVNSGAMISSQNSAFNENAKYSAFLVGYNGVYKTVLSVDEAGVEGRINGKAWVRYIHAIADSSSAVTVSIAGQSENAVYGTVSDYRPVNAGEINVGISSTNQFDVSQTVVLEQDKLYTVLFVGDPGSNSQNTAQARLVMNGKLN